MYKLERTRIGKIIFGMLASVFGILCLWCFAAGGSDLVFYGFTNTPLASLIMVASLFAAIICLAVCLTINALEKDIAEWLKILDNKQKDRH